MTNDNLTASKATETCIANLEVATGNTLPFNCPNNKCPTGTSRGESSLNTNPSSNAGCKPMGI
jgi:hypothetical protein